MWRREIPSFGEIDGMQYLKDEVAKHGREIEAAKEKSEECSDVLNW